MQTVMKVEDIVKEVTLALSNVFITKLTHSGKEKFTVQEVADLYVQSLHDTAKAYASEANAHDQKLH